MSHKASLRERMAKGSHKPIKTTSIKITALPSTKKKLEANILNLAKLLDIPDANKKLNEWVEHLADNLEKSEIKKLRATMVMKKLEGKVKSERKNHFKATIKRLQSQKIGMLDHFLYLVSKILEDSAVTLLLSQTAKSKSSAKASLNVEKKVDPSLFHLTGRRSPRIKQNSSPRTKQNSKLTEMMNARSEKRVPKSNITPSNSMRLPTKKSELSSSFISKSEYKSDPNAPIHTLGEEELPNLMYGSKIVLRVPDTGLYGIVDEDIDGKECVDFIVDSMNPLPFKIENAKIRGARSVVQFQDQIILYNNDGRYLSSGTGGAVNGRQVGEGAEFAQFYARVKWTICSTANADPVIGPVKIFDKIALRSCFGTFLQKSEVNKSKAIAKERCISAKQVWNIVPLHLPSVPNWLVNRSHMFSKNPDLPKRERFLSFLRNQKEEGKREKERLIIDSFNYHTFPIQEQLLLNDFLYPMIGIEGRWIRKKCGADKIGTFEFKLSCEIKDQTLKMMIERMLPICSYYSYVQHYADVHNRYEYGVVNHAFCNAIQKILKDYLLLVSHLEQQFRYKHALTLNRAWWYIQPALQTMECLHKICKLANEKLYDKVPPGGLLLNVIYDTMTKEGNSKNRALYSHLISEAAVPYFAAIELWIYHGVINDPLDEFEIKSEERYSKENIGLYFNDTYWENRYSLRSEKVPIFFNKKLSNKILTAGKYLNVIRECGQLVDSPAKEKIVYTENEAIYTRIINDAYNYASKILLDLLVRDKKLVPRLQSLKRYFLLEQGDFFVHFMDMVEEELNKSNQVPVTVKFDSLLQFALRMSNASSDPFKDDLSCYIGRYTLMQKLEAMHQVQPGRKSHARGMSHSMPGPELLRLDLFTLQYRVQWPLSIIISKTTLLKYELIFRHLFFCKHVERHLSRTWLNHQSTKELELNNSFKSSYILHRRMLVFVQTLTYYMMVEVLEPNWHRLMKQLETVNTVDDVLEHHNAFLGKCHKECLLTNQNLIKTIRKIMNTCLLFARNIGRFTEQTNHRLDNAEYQNISSKSKKQKEKHMEKIHRRKNRIAEKSAHIAKILGHKGYKEMIHRFVNHFDDKLRECLKYLKQSKKKDEHNKHLHNLADRIDYNGFYSKHFSVPEEEKKSNKNPQEAFSRSDKTLREQQTQKKP